MKKSEYWLLGISAAFNGFIALIAAVPKLLWDKVVKLLLHTRIDIGLTPEDAKSLFTLNFETQQRALRYLRIPVVIIVLGILIGLVLTALCVKTLLGYFEKFSKKTRLLTACIAAFSVVAAGIGAYYALRSEGYWLFFLLSVLVFAALVVLITAVYRWIVRWLNARNRISVVLSAVFGIACLPMALLAVHFAKLAPGPDFKLMGIYAVSTAVSALLFMLGLGALVSAFVKRKRFP